MMLAFSFRPPTGSLLVGRAPLYAWGKAPGLLERVVIPHVRQFRGDLLVHQGRYPIPDLAMKFAPEVHAHFPRNALLGVVHLEPIAWDDPEKWNPPRERHYRVSRVRALPEPIPWPFRREYFEVHSKTVQAALERLAIEALRRDRGASGTNEERERGLLYG